MSIKDHLEKEIVLAVLGTELLGVFTNSEDLQKAINTLEELGINEVNLFTLRGIATILSKKKETAQQKRLQ